jgi:hypothetical protein
MKKTIFAMTDLYRLLNGEFSFHKIQAKGNPSKIIAKLYETMARKKNNLPSLRG